MKLLTKVINIFDRTLNLLAAFAAVLVVFIMLMVVTEIVLRLFLTQTISESIEIAQYCLLFIAFFAATWVLRGEGHVKLDMVLDRLKPRTRAVVNAITSIICAVVCFIITWYGVKVGWEHFQLNYHLETPMSPPSVLIVGIVPIGYLLLFTQFLRRTRGYLKSLKG